MPFLAVQPTQDDRRAKGLTPGYLRNARIEPAPLGDPRVQYIITDTPGRTLRVTPGGLVRGVFRQSGIRGGALFAVCGSTLYRISDTWVATALGTVAGSDIVIMRGVGNDLVLLGGGELYFFGQSFSLLTEDNRVLLAEDGSQLLLEGESGEVFTTITPNLSGTGKPSTLAVIGGRLATNVEGLDIWDWSAPLEPFWWPDGAFAQSARRPDPIVAQAELNGDLWHLGETSVQPWRATGGDDVDAFDTLGQIILDVGIVGRFAWDRIGSSLAFIGRDINGALGAYVTSGYGASIVPNRELEFALAALSETELAEIVVSAWAEGSQQFVAVRLPNRKSAFVYDVSGTSWIDDATWSGTAWRGGLVAYAFGKTIWASPDAAGIYTLDPEVHADAGDTIERIITVRAPLQGPTTIHTLVIDIKCRNQPLTGQGSEPLIEVAYSRDGGRTTSELTGDVRLVRLPGQGEYARRVKLTRLGLFDGQHGVWLQMRITDPVGFALAGVYINEDPT